MRRKFFGLAVAAFATLGPVQAWGGDREIAEQIIKRLKTSRDAGALKDFTLDMKVDQGVVLFRGNVSADIQKDLVLQAANGIQGVAGVVDELSVAGIAPAAQPEAASAPQAEPEFAPTEAPTLVQKQPTLRQAMANNEQALQVMPGEIRRTAAVTPTDDGQLVSQVVTALSKAKEAGQLRGFGVDVKSKDGVLQLTGRASSRSQRDAIIRIAESIPGVAGVREAIAIPTAAPSLPRLPQPPSLESVAQPSLQPAGVPARVASSSGEMTAMAAPYRQNGQVTAIPASSMQGVVGQPVPMAPYNAVGAPRYDSPNLPNYAWPGYASHPNYAALTYPQQYSPSAWPYIGPFYPYPQVPLGWRKVSLEWDDGWWFLDFTDR